MPAAREWGPPISTRGLRDLYAPQKTRKRTLPPAGIDNLHLGSTDTFEIPGRGEIVVDFKGFFRVARGNPTSDNWATGDVYVNLIDLYLEGESSELGKIIVRHNPDRVSAGQTFAAGKQNAAAKCRIAANVTFNAVQAGITLNHAEPILLMNDAIDSIPPVEDPNGKAHIYRLPLFADAKAGSKPFGYLTSLHYTVGNYLSEEEGKRFMALAHG